ncbi:histidine phosphatase family protein [Rhodococcus pseudokoreensis]|uniref:Histidine phosphatase family protein n=1 Tax=Rhodococcus pseudokoreensis TaxID=2811421 RepID=A0A974ZYJ8_9NOCA|nr:histidine phosphatase family protein [Rhodococcus pseudokoreensis]QSE95125.1 histidine phosphatase family protein [Rhodococcus pseudokoreensis]
MSEATRSALVRHGRTDWNRRGLLQGHSDIPLDDVGRGQARDTARMLRDDAWDTVVTSPLSRAVDTGRIIAEHLGIDVTGMHSDFVERSYGAAEGMTREDAERRWPDGAFPDLEPLEAVSARGRRAIDAIARTHPGGRVVVITHGALIRAVLGDLSATAVPRIVNGAVCEIEWAGVLRVLSVNRTDSHSFADPG